MTVKGLTREREGERGREREARPGFSVFLLSSPLVLDVALQSEVICVLSAPLLTSMSEKVLARDTFYFNKQII